MTDEAWGAFAKRVQDAIVKAIREAKRNTSWINPDAEYEEATRGFVGRLLDPKGSFVPALGAFVDKVKTPGFLTSLTQLTIKATAPGVPDFYQGTEVWDFSMTDPDNRRPVDYVPRRSMMAELAKRDGDREALLRDVREHLDDGRLKMFMTRALLHARRDHAPLFCHGDYHPLNAEGARRDQVIAFARTYEGDASITVAGRYFASLGGGSPWDPATWDDTRIELPDDLRGAMRDVLSGRRFDLRDTREIGDLFAVLPFVVLVRS
jgi:(1->4)-alpha-D-glucan 1-alpha-D-glucosylmutase